MWVYSARNTRDDLGVPVPSQLHFLSWMPVTLRSGHFPLLFCVKNEEQTVMCGSSLIKNQNKLYQNKLEGVVVVERAWLKPGSWPGYSEKEKRSQEGTEWKSVPKINIP